jgi:hypothetical protein
MPNKSENINEDATATNDPKKAGFWFSLLCIPIIIIVVPIVILVNLFKIEWRWQEKFILYLLIAFLYYYVFC